MRLYFILLVVCFSSNETKAQKQRLIFNEYSFTVPSNTGKGNIVNAVDAYNRIYSDTSVVEYNPSLTDTFAYNQLQKKMPKAKADYVYYYSQWQNWPAGLVNYIKTHTSEEIGLFFNKNIVAYYFTRYDQCPYNAPRKYFLNSSNTRNEQIMNSYLIEIPAAENTSLPDSMKPATDIYITLRQRPGMNDEGWAQLGITGAKNIKKASDKLDAIVKASKEGHIDTDLYFKTIIPVKNVTEEILLQNYRQYKAYLDNIYLGYKDIAAAANKNEIDKLKEGLQAYKNLLNQAIDVYRDNCAMLMKAYNNKEYDKILLFSKWKVGFKFTGNASGPNGPHLYGNADHTLLFETINDNLRMNSHVVTSGIGDELVTDDKKVGDVFQDFNIWGDFKFAAGKFTPLPGQNLASFTKYKTPPFDLLPKYFLNKKVNGLLDADFTFIIETSGIYDYPVPLIILNGEKFALKWTYGDEFSSGIDLYNAEMDKLKKHIAELEKK
ncbi:MAG: hypothetical protein B6D37_01570 [Sphingobacteriales bacterium UTBCD1]|jgi:hypothetical protein|nr:MAG: hypothetical protein B6D37_01570 [Sphingobacteriales bacterium UTBCD1]